MEADARPKTTQRSSLSEGRVCPSCNLSVSSNVTICPNDGTSLLGAEEIGNKLADQYEFISVIATGGMGVIYEAKHLALGQKVAIKMMQTGRLDDAHVKRFKREAESLTALDHVNIIHVRDYGLTENGQPYMVLDFIDGLSLSEMIYQLGSIPLGTALSIFVQAADALVHAHERGVLHRDLKPGNIMVAESANQQPSVKLIDFGIAKVLTDESEKGLTQTGEVLGSPAYMSPEQTTGMKLDQRTDVYSLGCVMFEALTGTPPFQGATALDVIFQQINSKAPSLTDRSTDEFPTSLRQIVSQALQKDPDKRFQSMAEMRDQLVGVEIPKPGTKPSQGGKDQTPKSTTRQMSQAVLWCCVILFVFTILTSGFLIWQQEQAKHAFEQAKILEEKAVQENNAQKLQADQNLNANDLAREYIRRNRAHPNPDEPRHVRLRGEPCTDKALDEFGTGRADSDWIDIEESYVKGPGLAYLIRYPVNNLSLNGSSVSDRVFLELIHMPYLAELQIDSSEITNAGLKQLVGTKLRRISVRSDKITDEGMGNIADIRTLNTVQCGRNWLITDLGYAHLKKLPLLKSLDVQENRVTEKSASVIAQLKGLDNINLQNTTITDAGLKEVSTLPKLTSIGLTECKNISPASLKYLCKIPKLRKVDLDDNLFLKDEDLDFVRRCPALTELNLSGTGVSDAGMELIAKSGISDLLIEHTIVTDRGLMILAKDKNLRTLKVTEGPITEAGIKEFGKLRPHVLSVKKKRPKIQL